MCWCAALFVSLSHRLGLFWSLSLIALSVSLLLYLLLSLTLLSPQVNGQFKVPQRAPVIEEETGRQAGSASATGFHHYDYQREARTAVARRMEVEAQAAAVSEENAARAAREQQTFHPEGEISGLATFPGHFARAPGPEAAPWVTREGAGGQQQQVTRYSAEPTFGQTWIQSLPKGVKVSQKETVSQKLVRPPRPQELRRQRACGSWPRRAS